MSSTFWSADKRVRNVSNEEEDALIHGDCRKSKGWRSRLPATKALWVFLGTVGGEKPLEVLQRAKRASQACQGT